MSNQPKKYTDLNPLMILMEGAEQVSAIQMDIFNEDGSPNYYEPLTDPVVVERIQKVLATMPGAEIRELYHVIGYLSHRLQGMIQSGLEMVHNIGHSPDLPKELSEELICSGTAQYMAVRETSTIAPDHKAADAVDDLMGRIFPNATKH